MGWRSFWWGPGAKTIDTYSTMIPNYHVDLILGKVSTSGSFEFEVAVQKTAKSNKQG